MSDRTLVPTQSAFLELKEERAGMREGYRFLDEKRLILAAAILAELEAYEHASRQLQADFLSAVDALRAAVARHGVEGLAVYPAARLEDPGWQLAPRSVLGVALQDLTDPSVVIADVPASLATSPEGEACRRAFLALIPHAAELAARAANLDRLRADYARTARRARALEDVLLPELDETLRGIASALEELEREEVIRARRR